MKDRPVVSLRLRVLISIVAVAFAVLAVTAAGTAFYAHRTATDAEVQELTRKAPAIAASLQGLALQFNTASSGSTTPSGVAALRSVIAGTLRVSGGTIVVATTKGTIQEGVTDLFNLGSQSTLLDLPSPLRAQDLDPAPLLAGELQKGSVGGLAFVAVPLERVEQKDRTPVLVLTAPVASDPFGRSVTFFIAAAGCALAVAAFVSAYLARRLTRPLTAMEATARRIASGSFDAQVQLPSRPDRELAGLTAALNALGQQLAEARSLEREFLLNVSHDLRTPLTSIRGYAEALMDGALNNPEGAHRAGVIIHSEAQRLERLVRDLLDLGRLEAHQFSIHPQNFDAAATLQGLADAFTPQAAALGLHIQTDIPPTIATHGDPQRLAQAVSNLIENALKFAATNVTVRAHVERDQTTILVEDDGPGISNHDRTRVFERLYMSRTSTGRTVGTGLGLAIVEQLTTLMGGHVRVEPLQPTGSAFVMTLPNNTIEPTESLCFRGG